MDSTATRLPAARPVDPVSRGLRILLVEDHPVNQTVVLRMLEKRGFRVVVADDGRRALAALEAERFDLILMDVQMPGMSGLEVTALILEAERATGAHTPIVALTACVMKGDRERCLDAGMDAYLGKPVQAAQLLASIESLVPAPEQETGSMTSPRATAVDRETLLARLDGDAELLAEVAAIFLEDYPRLLEEVRAALASGDVQALARGAHTLKGSAGNFGPTAAVEAARELEEAGRREDLSSAREAFVVLDRELECLRIALLAIIDE